jgi:hypothetical protein
MPVVFESAGKSVQVNLSHTTGAMEPALIEGWLGITAVGGESGDLIALTIAQEEYQFDVPDALDVSKGVVVYVTLASVTAHEIPDGAFNTDGGAGTKALFRATADKDTSGGAGNHWVTGILLPEGV